MPTGLTSPNWSNTAKVSPCFRTRVCTSAGGEVARMKYGFSTTSTPPCGLPVPFTGCSAPSCMRRGCTRCHKSLEMPQTPGAANPFCTIPGSPGSLPALSATHDEVAGLEFLELWSKSAALEYPFTLIQCNSDRQDEFRMKSDIA